MARVDCGKGLRLAPAIATSPVMVNLLIVMAGGAVGAGLRYEVGRHALRLLGPGFPWGTWIVNLAGGLVIGLLAGAFARGTFASDELRLFLTVGILGGFTTFSAFSLEAANMIGRGQVVLAAAYALSSFAGSVLFLFLGLWLMRVTA